MRTMLNCACGRIASALRGARAPPLAVVQRGLRSTGSRFLAGRSERAEKPPSAFDPALLEFLVCPLSKKPLR